MAAVADIIEQIIRRQDTAGTSAAGSGAAGAGEPVQGTLGEPGLEDTPSLTVLPAALTTKPTVRPSLATAPPSTQSNPSSSSIINSKLAPGASASSGDTVSLENAAGEAKSSNSNAGAIAGAAVGCMLGGIIIGAILAVLFLRRRSRKSAAASFTPADVDGEKSEIHTDTLLYANKKELFSSSDIKALAAARSRIVALEKERNAASAFGDTLDRATESELVSKLAGVNERIAQISMALSVQVDGTIKTGAGPVPQALSETAVAALQKPDVPLESAVRHTINNILHARLCSPFCFMADARKSHSTEGLLRTVSRDFEQAQAGRWRIMSHTALRQASADTTGTTTISVVSNEVTEALAALCIWAGMDKNLISARQRVRSCTSGRLEEAAEVLGKLILKLREEMSTSEFSVVQAEPGSALSGNLGLSARLARGGSKRELVPAKAAPSSSSS